MILRVPCRLFVASLGAMAFLVEAPAWADTGGERQPGAEVPASPGFEPTSALREAELVIAELELALDAADLRCKELEEILGRKQERDLPLELALAAANAEAEAFRERYRDLRLNVESWGMESLGSDSALRERLLVAVREREQAMRRHSQALSQLLALSESIVDYLKTSAASDAKSRLRVEAELRKTDEVIGFGSRRPVQDNESKALDEGRVVSLKEDYRLAVLDIGRRSGVRLGLPLDLYRKDRLVGSGVVVDVRDQVCGVIIQKLYKDGDQVRISDRAEPRTSSTIQF